MREGRRRGSVPLERRVFACLRRLEKMAVAVRQQGAEAAAGSRRRGGVPPRSCAATTRKGGAVGSSIAAAAARQRRDRRPRRCMRQQQRRRGDDQGASAVYFAGSFSVARRVRRPEHEVLRRRAVTYYAAGAWSGWSGGHGKAGPTLSPRQTNLKQKDHRATRGSPHTKCVSTTRSCCRARRRRTRRRPRAQKGEVLLLFFCA